MTEFDLNLLRSFVALYDSRSVTAAAATLHVAQPTLSYSLGKLRRLTHDELFTRSASGMQPTPAADRLYDQLSPALAQLEQAVAATAGFQPKTAAHAFTIGLSDLGEMSLLPQLIAATLREAPASELRVVPLDVDAAPEALVRGELDAFIASPRISSTRISRIPLFAEHYVALLRLDHPRLPARRIGLAQLRRERHIEISGATGHDGPRLALAEHGLSGRAALRLNRFSGLPYLLGATDLIAVLPSQIAHQLAGIHRLAVRELAISIPAVEVSLYARHGAARTPPQLWLVELMRATLTQPVTR